MSYTEKTDVPQYVPTGKRRDSDMINLKKYSELLADIENLRCQMEKKNF